MNTCLSIYKTRMKNILTLCLTYCLFICTINAQGPTLAPSIGLFSQPVTTDSICPIQTYLDPNGTYLLPGLSNAQLIPDFTLYDRAGNAMNMQTKLATLKPVLIVSGSYTCPVFRNKINLINNLKTNYGSSLDIFIVYTVEAHPTDISPYFGTVNIGSANTNAGILFAQPKTYGQRVAMVDTLISRMNITVPVYIDGPCNSWWNTYGPAPNNAYLITTQGKVFTKNGWFNKGPLHNIQYEIDSLLNLGGGGGNPVTGTFGFQMLGDSTVTGAAGTTLFTYSKLFNNSTNPVTLDVIRLENNVPLDWSTSMCTDVCLPPYIDTTQLYLAPGDTQSFTMYFYTGVNPNSGNTKMLFKNVNDSTNVHVQKYYANSVLNTGIQSELESAIKIFPNPASGNTEILLDQKYLTEKSKIHIFDSSGKLVNTVIPRETSSILSLKNSGIYFIQVSVNDKIVYTEKLINTAN